MKRKRGQPLTLMRSGQGSRQPRQPPPCPFSTRLYDGSLPQNPPRPTKGSPSPYNVGQFRRLVQRITQSREEDVSSRSRSGDGTELSLPRAIIALIAILANRN